MAEMTADGLLEALLRKAEAGELPSKKAEMLRHLKSRIAAGQTITEMQEELLRDLGEACGVC